MIPDRIGTIGRTHGVKANTSPARKKPPNMRKMLPEVMRDANRSCSETKPVDAVVAEAPAASASSAALQVPAAEEVAAIAEPGAAGEPAGVADPAATPEPVAPTTPPPTPAPAVPAVPVGRVRVSSFV